MDSVFMMVVLIVLISCGAGVANNYLRNQRKRAEADADPEVRAELDRLRERVEVLEKIVTDEKFHLAKEINRLEREP
jgi:cell division protein FtsB